MKNINAGDVCMLMLSGTIAAMGGAVAYSLIKDANITYTVNTNYTIKSKEDEDTISSEYRDSVDFFDDFVDDCV